MQQIHVDISEEGEVKVEAIGCRGRSCDALTREIEEAIGRTTGDVKKPEYHQQHGQQTGAINAQH